MSFVRLWSGVHTPPSSLAPRRPLRVMSIHQAVHPFLFTSITLIQPPSFAFYCSFSPPRSLPPLTYLHLLPLPLCLPVPPTHFTLFLSETLLSLPLPPFFPHSIISPYMPASPLFFVTHFLYPILSLFRYSEPYCSQLVCCIKIFGNE